MADSQESIERLDDASKEKESEYLVVLNKKIRTLTKKLNTNIANIEKKVKSGATINEDEQKVLANKPNVLKSLKDFEELKTQMVKIQEDKAQKKPKRKVHSETKQEELLQPLIELLHVSDFFERSRTESYDPRRFFLDHQEKRSAEEGKSYLVRSDSEIDSLLQLADLIRRSALGVPSASQHAAKFLAHSEDEAFVGVPYKHLRLLVSEVVSSPAFSHKPPVVEEKREVEQQEAPSNHLAPAHVETNQVPSEQTESKENGVAEEVGPGAETEEEPAAQESSEEGRERRDPKRGGGFRRPRPARGRGRGNYGGQEGGSPKEGSYPKEGNYQKEGNYSRERRGGNRGSNRGGEGGNRRGGGNRGSNRGSVGNQKPVQQSTTQS